MILFLKIARCSQVLRTPSSCQVRLAKWVFCRITLPLLSSLKPGFLKVRFEGQEQIFTITGGVVEVQPDQIIILADAAENVMEIDIARVEQARQRAEELLRQGPPPDTDTYLAIEAALKRSSLRLDAARRFRGQRTNFPTRSDSMREDSTT